MYGEGSKCKLYSGYNDDWRNGHWCHANVDTCQDAKAHPAREVDNLPGYGASKAACGFGKYIHIFGYANLFLSFYKLPYIEINYYL